MTRPRLSRSVLSRVYTSNGTSGRSRSTTRRNERSIVSGTVVPCPVANARVLWSMCSTRRCDGASTSIRLRNMESRSRSGSSRRATCARALFNVRHCSSLWVQRAIRVAASTASIHSSLADSDATVRLGFRAWRSFTSSASSLNHWMRRFSITGVNITSISAAAGAPRPGIRASTLRAMSSAISPLEGSGYDSTEPDSDTCYLPTPAVSVCERS